MRQQAKHLALQSLANIMLPSLMEDIDTKELIKTMPKKVKEKIKEPEIKKEVKKKKPKNPGLSLTRLISDQNQMAVDARPVVNKKPDKKYKKGRNK